MEILLLPAGSSAEPVLPALELLNHSVVAGDGDLAALLLRVTPDVVMVDARSDLIGARGTCRMLRATGLRAPLLAVVTEGGLTAIAVDWGLDDVLLCTAGPAEIDARLRLAVGTATSRQESPDGIRVGDLVIDPTTYVARLRGRPLDLTYKEFELLRFLAQHPGRVFSREQLLRQVWGYDYYGGTRTVDVHVRRLRAKLGNEHEALIGTVRQVGYRFVAPPHRGLPDEDRVVA